MNVPFWSCGVSVCVRGPCGSGVRDRGVISSRHSGRFFVDGLGSWQVGEFISITARFNVRVQVVVSRSLFFSFFIGCRQCFVVFLSLQDEWFLNLPGGSPGGTSEYLYSHVFPSPFAPRDVKTHPYPDFFPSFVPHPKLPNVPPPDDDRLRFRPIYQYRQFDIPESWVELEHRPLTGTQRRFDPPSLTPPRDSRPGMIRLFRSFLTAERR